MKPYLFLTFLFWSSLATGQTPFQPFEVDSAAEPRGGMVFLNTFIQACLRKPVPAQAAGVGGRVILEGVVEPNGQITDVKVMQRFRPDCDREAIRVFKLFNAWKPALKNGQAVRQRVMIPVIFQANPPFTYLNGARITYFGADNKVTSDSTQAKYKQLAPIDTNGVSAGDVVVYEAKSKGWKEYYRMPLVHRKNSKPTTNQKITYTVGNQNFKQDWEGTLYLLDEAGTIINQSFYQDGKPTGSELSYHANGCIAQKKDESTDRTAYMNWYANGQIKQIKAVSKTSPLVKVEPELVTAFWDSTGHQQIVNGNGRAIYHTQVQSDSDTTKHTLLVEQGQYQDGLKQGVWTGRNQDGSYFYEEAYDKGICQSGKAQSASADTVRYTTVMQHPEFKGGMQGLGQFLSQNLKYPAEAQKAGAQGRVFISFVVCTDGTLCDYEVLKGVQSDLDREAVRVVQQMSGKWRPGVQRGQKVRVKYNLPINFTLN
ncbi:TonB family protein [Spirosoma sp. KNUC1025]|uniref:TonB family protein n=1 Tax=Spirosoma sp. KNUC1025 TaxID=2894082 RepID=UPI003866A7A9|nr:TonB family protein [Spirosoma sp. KNUC1025]